MIILSFLFKCFIDKIQHSAVWGLEFPLCKHSGLLSCRPIVQCTMDVCLRIKRNFRQYYLSPVLVLVRQHLEAARSILLIRWIKIKKSLSIQFETTDRRMNGNTQKTTDTIYEIYTHNYELYTQFMKIYTHRYKSHTIYEISIRNIHTPI